MTDTRDIIADLDAWIAVPVSGTLDPDAGMRRRGIMRRARDEIVALRAKLGETIDAFVDGRSAARIEALEEAAEAVESNGGDNAQIHANAIRALKDRP